MGLKIKQVGSLLSALLHRISPQNAMFCMPNIFYAWSDAIFCKIQ